MIAKVEQINISQENKSMLEDQKESEKVQNTLVQFKEMMNNHKDISLPKILKEKQCISTRIGDFFIDCVLDEETQVNIMIESTWEILGKPIVVPSLGRIGLFKGNMITLCGRVTKVPVIIHGTLTQEEFEVISFVENNVPFPILLGKTWIKEDQMRRKAKEEATENKNKELRDLIARRIDKLMEEQEVDSKQQNARELVVEGERMQECLKDLYMQERRIPTLELVRKEVLPLNPLKAHQQGEATTPRKDKNNNVKRNPETQITGKKARTLSKKKDNLEKLQEVPEKTLQEASLSVLNVARTTESCKMGLPCGEAI
jgi:hypothetical protein